MRWSYRELMELPGDLYPELLAWLIDEQQTQTDPDG